MKAAYTGLVLLQLLAVTIGVCVLESEFGFILNCNFKKSGLFRVRNLGGLKAHFGFGISLGDELGFGESLGNLEANRRRSINSKTGFVNKVGNAPQRIDAQRKRFADSNDLRISVANQNKSSMTEVVFLPLGVPTFRPIPTMTNLAKRRSDIVLPSETIDNSFTETGILRNQDSSFSVTDMLQNQDNVTFVTTINPNSRSTPATKTMIIYNEFKNVTHDQKNKVDITHTNDNTIQKFDFTKIADQKKGESTQVMNAPKEYYPTGYDKNFDDNFRSKVKFSVNNFRCADQKYFPGLYANIELGCMVFHVCAITEQGIVMKSFLCPESTLFDQSILKCNWWFYVECNDSIYDSNIPVSKSYQLVKSLSMLSNVTKY